MSDHRTQHFVRFLVSDRVLHLLLLTSFSMLALTGLVQKYADAGISIALIRAMGGIEQTRVFHHTFAVILILTSIAHAVQVGYRVFVQRKSMSMLPTLSDLTDFLTAIKYNVGLSKQRPHFPRFNFMEKIEYWAVVWGTILMTITGYVLWNPILITQVLPGEVVPAAKIAHGLEAVLAVLSIITWHVYYVHVKIFNKSIFTGKISEEEMEEDHPKELERIRQGKVWKPVEPEVRYSRLKLYAPLATLFVLVSVLATWRWLTAETTAITTVPRAAIEEQAYQPMLPTPRAVRLEVTPQPTPLRVLHIASDASGEESGETAAGGLAQIPHPVDGAYSQCQTCHASTSAMRPAPANHDAFTNQQCTTCHAVAAASPDAPVAMIIPTIQHRVSGDWAQCSVCHAVEGGMRPMPTDHTVFQETQCLTCHRTGDAPAMIPTSVIRHRVTGDWAQCSLCHAIEGGMRPMLADHASFQETECLTCHRLEGGDQ
jgi:cytochrome b subunit of formate dehydrogenase